MPARKSKATGKRVPGVRLRSAILCEEIRTTAEGKTLLFGVHTAEFLAAERPTAVKLNALLTFEYLAEGDYEIEFKVEAPWVEGAGLIAVEGAVPGQHVDAIAPFRTFLSEPAEVTLSWREKDGEWNKHSWSMSFEPDVEPYPEDVAKLVMDNFLSSAELEARRDPTRVIGPNDPRELDPRSILE